MCCPHRRSRSLRPQDSWRPEDEVAGFRMWRARSTRRAQPALSDSPGRGAPLFIVAPAAIGLAFLVLPLVALLVRAPWSGLPELLSDSQVLTALRLSLECATAATIVSLILGVPLAWVLARLRFPGLGLVRALVTLPLVLPPVVGGLALRLAFGRNGIIGRYLDDWFGI